MKTDIITINSNGTGFRKALDETEKAALASHLDDKTRIRIRLLAEETIGMVGAITSEFEALYWAEIARKKGCRIHLKVYTDMNRAKKSEFLSASKSGKNEAAKGFMGRMKDFLENGRYSLDSAGSLANDQGNASLMYGTTGFDDKESSSIVTWSLRSYKEESRSADDLSFRDREVWDELEKSIVANIADDVRVYITGDSVELLIETIFGGSEE